MIRSAIAFILILASALRGQEQPTQPPPQTPPQQPPAQPVNPPPASPPALPPAQPEQPQIPTDRPVTWSFKALTEIGFNASMDGPGGKLSESRIGGEFEVGIPIATMSQLTFGFDYEYSRYDFSNATGIAPGVTDPFENINRETFRVRYGQMQTMRLSWMVSGYIALSAEEGADLGDSIVGGVIGGADYYLSRSLKVGGGVGIFSRFGDTLVLPIPSLTWEIDKEWRLATAGKLGATLFYTPSEQWTFSAGGWYDERNFRLAENGPIPNGIARDSSVPLQIGATYQATPNFTIDGGVGVRLFNNIKIDNANHFRTADFDVDPSPYLSLAITLKF